MLPVRYDENLTSVLYDFHDLFKCESTLGSEIFFLKQPQRVALTSGTPKTNGNATLYKYGRRSRGTLRAPTIS